MKWPLMLVATHNATVAGRDAVIQGKESLAHELRAEIRRLHAANADLLTRYHALKVIGGNEPQPKPQISPAKPQGPIAEAIDEVCARYGNSVKLRRRLMKYAEDMKRSDGEDAEIAHAILHWRSPDEEDAA